MESLIGQNEVWEARQLWKRGVELVNTISDEEVKKEESDAMQEMRRKIDVLDQDREVVLHGSWSSLGKN